MIKSIMGSAKIEGTGIEIEADFCVLIKAYREMLSEKGFTEIQIEQKLWEIVRDSSKSEEELREELSEIKKECTSLGIEELAGKLSDAIIKSILERGDK